MTDFRIVLEKNNLFASYVSYKNKKPNNGLACQVSWKGRLTPKRFGIALKEIGNQILKEKK